MRIRQIKGEFWKDELLASLPDSARLFYIGIWQEADDGGWLRWNVPEIALDLYGYQPRTRRERWVKERGEALVAIGRLHFYDCGHAYLPTLTKHQKFGGRPAYTVRDAHARDCAPQIAIDRPGKVGKGRVGKGKVDDLQSTEPTHDPLAAVVGLAALLGPERLERIQRRADSA